MRQQIERHLDKELILTFQNIQLDEVSRKKLSKMLANKGIDFKYKSTGKLVTVKDKGKKRPPEIIHYKPIEVANIVANLLSVFLDPSNLVIIGSAVVDCCSSLRNIREKILLADGALFWAIYNSEGHCATGENAKKLFDDVCKYYDGVSSEDFTPALKNLLRLGIIKESAEGTFKVMEKVRILNTAHIFES